MRIEYEIQIFIWSSISGFGYNLWSCIRKHADTRNDNLCILCYRMAVECYANSPLVVFEFWVP